MKKSFLIYVDALDVLDELNDTEAAGLIRAIQAYHRNTLDLEKLPKILKIIMKGFISQFERDNKKYQEVVEKRRVSGKMGGLAKASKCYQKLAKPSKAKQNLHDNDNDNDNDIKSSNEDINNIFKKEKYKKEKKEREAFLLDQFEQLWQQYPEKDGKKEALRHFKATVKKAGDLKNIQQGLANYLHYLDATGRWAKGGKTWFNNWEEWINRETTTPPSNQTPADRMKAAALQLLREETNEPEKGAILCATN